MGQWIKSMTDKGKPFPLSVSPHQPLSARSSVALRLRDATPLVPAGELVPDQLVLGLIQEGIKKPECSAGFVLDGYPRTLQQAIAVQSLLRAQWVHSS